MNLDSIYFADKTRPADLKVTRRYIELSSSGESVCAAEQATAEAAMLCAERRKAEVLNRFADLKYFESSLLMQPDAREALRLVLYNHEVLDMNKLMEVLIPFIKTACANETRKTSQRLTAQDIDYDEWLEKLQSGEINFNREHAADYWRWPHEELVQRELEYAQQNRELNPHYIATTLEADNA